MISLVIEVISWGFEMVGFGTHMFSQSSKPQKCPLDRGCLRVRMRDIT